MVDQQYRGSNGKAKIEGYTRVSDEEAHQQSFGIVRVVKLELLSERVDDISDDIQGS